MPDLFLDQPMNCKTCQRPIYRVNLNTDGYPIILGWGHQANPEEERPFSHAAMLDRDHQIVAVVRDEEELGP